MPGIVGQGLPSEFGKQASRNLRTFNLLMCQKFWYKPVLYQTIPSIFSCASMSPIPNLLDCCTQYSQSMQRLLDVVQQLTAEGLTMQRLSMVPSSPVLKHQ